MHVSSAAGMTERFWLSGVPLALCAALLFISGCTTNPATGKSMFSLVSPEEEQAMGEDTHRELVERYGVYEELPGLNAYASVVAARVHHSSELAGQRMFVTVLDDPAVNAYAVPGGYVYLTRGLMALANSEAELAGVIGHEIAHVAARHAAQRITTGMLTGLVVAAVDVAAGNPGLTDLAALVSGLAGAGFSREQESEADEIGVRYLSQSGYEPLAMASFLGQLKRQSALAERIALRDGGSGWIDHWFSTHPRTEDRVVAAANLARASQAGAMVGRNAYLERIDGMIYGDGPEQGFVRGRVFSHPGIGLTFEVPDGFVLTNGHRSVTATDGEDAAIVFDTAPGNAHAMTAYVQDWADELTGSAGFLRDLRRLDVNGMEAATGWRDLRLRQGDSRLRFMTVRFSDTMVCRFLYVAPSQRAHALDEPFRQSAFSFRRLRQSEIDRLRPLRLRIRKVAPGDTIESLSDLMAFDSLRRERFMVLNGLAAPGDLRPGMLVKIVSDG